MVLQAGGVRVRMKFYLLWGRYRESQVHESSKRNISPTGSMNMEPTRMNFYAATGIKAGGRVAGREVPGERAARK